MTEINKQAMFPYSVSQNIQDLEVIARKHIRGCQCAYCRELQCMKYVQQGLQLGCLPKGINP